MTLESVANSNWIYVLGAACIILDILIFAEFMHRRNGTDRATAVLKSARGFVIAMIMISFVIFLLKLGMA